MANCQIFIDELNKRLELIDLSYQQLLSLKTTMDDLIFSNATAMENIAGDALSITEDSLNTVAGGVQGAADDLIGSVTDFDALCQAVLTGSMSETINDVEKAANQAIDAVKNIEVDDSIISGLPFDYYASLDATMEVMNTLAEYQKKLLDLDIAKMLSESDVILSCAVLSCGLEMSGILDDINNTLNGVFDGLGLEESGEFIMNYADYGLTGVSTGLESIETSVADISKSAGSSLQGGLDAVKEAEEQAMLAAAEATAPTGKSITKLKSKLNIKIPIGYV